MPLRVSEWSCRSNSDDIPTLIEVGLRAETMKLGTLLKRQLSGSADNGVEELTPEWFCQILHCDSCVIFSDLSVDCTCGEVMHRTCGTGPCSNRPRGCDLMSEAIVELALKENNVIISNCPGADPRFSPPTFPVDNAAAVPVFLGEMKDAKRIGLVFFANKEGGFSAADYVAVYPFIMELASRQYARHAERQIAVLSDVLAAEQDRHISEIQRLSRSRDAFIATMSHEIRTPLNAVSGYNELMAKKAGMHLEQSHLRKQRDAILQLTQLIANILDYSKLRSESLRLTMKPFSPKTVLQQTVTLCREDAKAKHLSIEMSTKNVPKSLLGDEVRIRQIYLNLVGNAIKFSSVGGSVIVEMSCTERDTMIELTGAVTDTGCGIAQDKQAVIFEEFSQIRETSETSASVQGVGLGLAICRELVGLMRGKISVDSDGHSGSRFTFSVMLNSASDVAKMVDRMAEYYKGCPVLIADDLEVNRIVLSRALIDWGFRPHTCSSVDEAVHMLEAFPADYFRIALIDIDLAGDSGVRLARIVARDTRLGKILLVAVSSLGTSFAGADEFDLVHEKPIQPSFLLTDLERASHIGPRARTSSHPRSTRSCKMDMLEPETIADCHVLLVDDDAPSVSVLEDMLVTLGFCRDKLHTAPSGKAALKILREHVGTITCVLMDLVMPVMSGIECIRVIRNNQETYGCPIIYAVSADAVDKTRLSAVEVGADGFICKPVSMVRLDEMLRVLYRSARPKRSGKKRKTK